MRRDDGSRQARGWLALAGLAALLVVRAGRADARSVDPVLSSCLQHVGESTAYRKVRDKYAEAMTGSAIGNQGAFVVLGQLHDACEINRSLIDALDVAVARCGSAGVTAADLGYLRTFDETLAEAKVFRDARCATP